jgi:paraquat-inducible protein B
VSRKNTQAATPVTETAQRWNIVWVVPILAVLIGGWLLIKNLGSNGPEIEIWFETADGLAAGKTEVKCRSVSVGKVTKIELSEDLKSVVVHCILNAESENLLRQGTQFWVVRPRVTAADVSGLGTLLTGAYIELDPGKGTEGGRKWEGLETPPATSRSIPGRRLTLVSDEARSLIVGSPVYYRGFEVGRVEARSLDLEGRRILHEVFIEEKYQNLVTRNTRFWNTSGIDIAAGVDGFKIRTPSFQAMVSGGVSFSVPDGLPAGRLVDDGATFDLHRDADSAASSTFNPSLQLLLLFDQSVRGLSKNAPVEYRGITIGRVRNISFDYVPDIHNQKVPVLVEIDPSLLRASRPDDSEEDDTQLADAVHKGLRATLKTGSLLTGAMYVDFDYYPDEIIIELSYKGDFPVVPTMYSGFAQLEVKLASILDKIDKLPLDNAVKQFATTAEETRAVLNELALVAKAARETIENPDFKQLPAEFKKTIAELEKSIVSLGPDGTVQGDLLRTLDEFRSAMRSMEALSDTIKEKPNSIFFGKEGSKDARPKAVGPRR